MLFLSVDRNDGKTDSVIRNYQGELNRKNAQSRAERPEQSIRLGRLLRRRMMDARAKEDVSRRVSDPSDRRPN